MRYLITGANGFVGRYFIEYLQDHEKDATIFGADMSEICLTQGVEYMQIDLNDSFAVYRMLEQIKPDYIVHLAAMSSVAQSWQDPTKCFLNNVSVFLNIADGVRKLDIKCRILSVGSSEEYGIYNEPMKENFTLHPKSPYSVARLSQEYLSKLYVDYFKLDIVITRSFNHIGPRQNQKFVIPYFVHQLVKISKGEQNDIKVGNIDIIRDFLDVRDVVDAYYKILKNSKTRQVYNVCSGNGYKLRDIIDMVSRCLGITPKIITEKSRFRVNEIMSVIGDNTKLKTELDWKPQYTIEKTLFDMIKEFDYRSI